MGIETILEFVIMWLAGTIKNPESRKSERLIKVVGEINDLTGQFLEQVGAKKDW